MPLPSGPLALCEGRPNEPCPYKATGTRSQGDLMLCRKCEEFRFPYLCADQKPKEKLGKSENKGRVKTRATVKQCTPVPSDTSDKVLKLDNCSDDTELCPLCAAQVIAADSLKCDICNKTLHYACAGLTRNTATILRSIINETGWVCLPCRTDSHLKIHLLQSNQAKLAEELAELKDGISDIRTTSMKDSVLAASATDDGNLTKFPDIATVVRRELSDVMRRKSNVIITGLPECQMIQGRVITDDEAFCILCEEHLTVKPSIARQGCRRLGQVRTDADKPRRLLVPLTSEENAKSLLSVARKLRRSEDTYVATNIYINPDLTPAQAKMAYEKRVRRRQGGQSGERQMHRNRINRGTSSSASYSADPLPVPTVRPVVLNAVSYTHLRAHETPEHLVCRST